MKKNRLEFLASMSCLLSAYSMLGLLGGIAGCFGRHSSASSCLWIKPSLIVFIVSVILLFVIAIMTRKKQKNRTDFNKQIKLSANQASSSFANKETLDDWMEHNGIPTKSLIDTKSDVEREKIFAQHLQDVETAKSATRQFNKQYVWPARKKALQDELDKSDLTTTDRQMFADRLDSLDEEMPEQSFTSFSQELKKFQEQHIRKQNHIKYEGRLSNKDIQSIKEYHGYICMGCGLNPATEYGEQMKYMLEAHHKKPWGQMEENSSRVVSLEDFLILYPNWHKIIHKLESADDLETLQGIVRNK